ncbi:cbb3-type cytochrome c oxidase subunit I [Synechococcus elongatus]|uniref:Cbb3-type cytochrome c oxidase subunit I n=1 Tax=Synechococcus elongatus PCC 11801 TaxID=2219813 RepID=A0AAN1QLM1_SYNEL|nr:cbb3-type cytochrome c oxidase subunit I [Synechococcus elongatus]AZB71636.1 cb-type cytochrome C oxidase subunit I [Synechococcus elongatus PCC 11801]
MTIASPTGFRRLPPWLARLAGSSTLSESQPDHAAWVWLGGALVWMILGMCLGMIAAIKLTYPDFLGGTAPLGFGRVRPEHVNTILFGWIVGGEIGAALYILPRVCQRSLILGELASLSGWAYHIAVLLGLVSVSLGWTKGAEYEEWVRGINLAVVITVNLTALCLALTVFERRVSGLFVSVWYFFLFAIAFDFIYIPANLSRNAGAEGAVINWYYGHNAVGSVMTGAGLAIAYYVVPRLLNRQLFAHGVATLSFWTFAGFYIWNGGHHLLYGPVPRFITMMGYFAAFGMTLPFVLSTVSLWGTIWGQWRAIWESIAVRFAVLAAFVYFWASASGAMLAWHELTIIQHFSDNTIAHVHLAFLGFTTPALNALLYLMVERGLRRPLIPVLQKLHWWMFVIGCALYILPIYGAAFFEGVGWFQQVPFSETVALRYPYYYLRMYSGLFLIGGQLAMVWNLIYAWRSPALEPVAAIESPVWLVPGEDA